MDGLIRCFSLTLECEEPLIMKCKRHGRKQSWPDLRYYPECYGETEENHENLSEYLVSGHRFEPGTSRIRSSAIHSAMKFGESFFAITKCEENYFLNMQCDTCSKINFATECF
jgi:hypothetical protein